MQGGRFRTRGGCRHAHQHQNVSHKNWWRQTSTNGVASPPTHQLMHAGSFSNSAKKKKGKKKGKKKEKNKKKKKKRKEKQ